MPRLYSFVIPMILNGHYLSNIYLVLCWSVGGYIEVEVKSK